LQSRIGLEQAEYAETAWILAVPPLN